MLTRFLAILAAFAGRFLPRVTPVFTHRMAGWLFGGLVLAVTLALSFGQLRAVFGFKSLLVIWGVYLGYWASRGVFRDYRPDYFLTTPWSDATGREGPPQAVGTDNAIAFAAAVLARAIIVAAVVLALALGA